MNPMSRHSHRHSTHTQLTAIFFHFQLTKIRSSGNGNNINQVKSIVWVCAMRYGICVEFSYSRHNHKLRRSDIGHNQIGRKREKKNVFLLCSMILCMREHQCFCIEHFEHIKLICHYISLILCNSYDNCTITAV